MKLLVVGKGGREHALLWRLNQSETARKLYCAGGNPGISQLAQVIPIAQDDFAKLGPRQRGVITTDAFPDRKYEGFIEEISPEANRQKATVQIKVRVVKPDDFLRPEMNANVAFISDAKPAGDSTAAKPVIVA